MRITTQDGSTELRVQFRFVLDEHDELALAAFYGEPLGSLRDRETRARQWARATLRTELDMMASDLDDE